MLVVQIAAGVVLGILVLAGWKNGPDTRRKNGGRLPKDAFRVAKLSYTHGDGSLQVVPS
jgi:hypothetical protein